jgi:hypothetical protein
MIDPRLDILVWACVLLVLVLLGVRAWAVETAGARVYRTSTRVRALNISVGLALAALVGLLALQGGVLLVQAIITGTDPQLMVTIVGTEPDPAAPADPNAPPADANPAGPDANPAGPDPNPAGPDANPPGPDPNPPGPGPNPPGPDPNPAGPDPNPAAGP